MANKEGKRRSAAMRETHLSLVTGWIIRGWTGQRMAAELGISEAQASRDITEVERRWRLDTYDYRVNKSRELAAIDRQIDELWGAWEKSKRPTNRRSLQTHRGTFAGRGSQGEIETREGEESYGDPRIMAEITKLREQRIKLLGLNEPTKIALTDTQGKSIFPELSDDELNTAFTILKQAGLPAPANIADHQRDSGGNDRPDIIDAELAGDSGHGNGEGLVDTQ